MADTPTIRRVKLKTSVSFMGGEWDALLPEIKKPACTLSWWGPASSPVGIKAVGAGGETVYVPLGNIRGILEGLPDKATSGTRAA